jgi:hypothetical protein
VRSKSLFGSGLAGLGLTYAGRGLSIRRTSQDCAKWRMGLVGFSRRWGGGASLGRNSIDAPSPSLDAIGRLNGLSGVSAGAA